jgi:hypothetical protein
MIKVLSGLLSCRPIQQVRESASISVSAGRMALGQSLDPKYFVPLGTFKVYGPGQGAAEIFMSDIKKKSGAIWSIRRQIDWNTDVAIDRSSHFDAA